MIGIRFSDLGWPVVCPMVSIVTQHWSNHVDLMAGDDVAISALPGGVRERRISAGMDRRSEIIPVPCAEDQKAAAVNYARSQIGKGYDYAGVMLFSFAPRWNDETRWFCSELTAAALQHAGIINIPKSLWRVSPGNLFRILSR